MKLLLADQNRDILLMYQTLFAGRGDDVTAAFDGTQVADHLTDERYDLMIVNADIPRVRAARLVQMAKDRQTPSIALTGSADQDRSTVVAPATAFVIDGVDSFENSSANWMSDPSAFCA